VRVAINTRLLIQNKIDGIGRFAFETLKRITTTNPNVEFHFIFDRPFSSDFMFNNNITPHVLSPKTRHPIFWYIWFELQLPKLLKTINPNVFFSPDGFIPTNCPYPSVTTIHDLNFEHNPKYLKWTHSLFYRKFFKTYAENSDKIITVSNFSKEDIIKTYGISPEKIHVVYNGVSDDFKTVSNDRKIEIKNKYTNGVNFFVFIGSLHKRKNIKNLLLSFDNYKKNNRKLKLVIIGEQKWLDRETEKIYKKMKFREEVVFLGRIGNMELAEILGSATALCLISFFEGFGLPIIEAMKCSVPVIASNTTCIPEIVENAGIIINPNNINAITDAMLQIEENDEMRKKLINQGAMRATCFNWEVSANKIWDILKLTKK